MLIMHKKTNPFIYSSNLISSWTNKQNNCIAHYTISVSRLYLFVHIHQQAPHIPRNTPDMLHICHGGLRTPELKKGLKLAIQKKSSQ